MMSGFQGQNDIVPTAPVGDSSNQAASTQFVTLAIAAASTPPTPAFPAGTLMLFQQTSAPTGWTKITTFNDAILRVVSGTTANGGSNGFSTVNAQTTVGNHTLTLSEIPSHSHTVPGDSGGAFGSTQVATLGQTNTTSITSGSAGSGAAHNHTITMNMLYVDVIVAQKS